jgi:putative ABC transport system permease protein
LLKADELATEKRFIEKERQLNEEMVQLEDDYRIIMRNMGYNILIVNKGQDMGELERLGYATTYMNYEDVWKLAESGIKTLNHLLPVLQEKIHWKEKDFDIYLSGIRGQVPVYSKPGHLTADFEYRSPIMERVPDGMADIGEEIAKSLNLRPGDKITIQGEQFEINRIYPQKGTKDDLTVWVPLDKAQYILGKKDLINGILALECVCVSETTGQAKKEIVEILPDVKVFEFSSLIAARADVRKRAEELHEEIMTAEIVNQKQLRREKEGLASILVIILIAGASAWIFVMILNNVRERKQEIGILRAIGFSRIKVLHIFLGKSAIMGLVAGLAGCLAGIFLGIYWSGAGLNSYNQLLNAGILVPGLLLSPVLALAAGFIPSLIAATQDPATVLSNE